VLKEIELIKAKGAKDRQQKEHLRDSFIETMRRLHCGGTNKQPTTTNEKPLQNNKASA
jgi:hypothetical protein